MSFLAFRRFIAVFSLLMSVVGFHLLIPVIATAESDDDVRLAEVLMPVIAAHEGTVAVEVRHLTTGVQFLHRADAPMPTASLIKFPIMVAAYQAAADGKLDLTASIELEEQDKVPGSGILTSHFSAGMRLSLRDAIRLMIVYSDNTATNLVLDRMGLAATSDLMRKSQYPNTQLHSKVYRGETSIAPDRSKEFGLGSTTADEMIRLLAKLHQRELVSAEASKQMYEHLLACEDKPRFSRFLPKETRVAIKTGSVSGSRTAAGIIESPAGAIAVCVLTSNNKDQRWTEDNAAVSLCAEIARRAYDRFNPATLPVGNEKGADQTPNELVQGAGGELVEALQRTLNKQLAGSKLSIDGDFGPATRQKVVAFQRSRNLPETGIVSAETWKALGPLVETDEESSKDPAAINQEVLPVARADSLVGPPFVTARAWAIADARSGQILWQDKGDERRDIASMTKIMTAWIVLQHAAKAPTLLEQPLTLSSQADRTPGSTSRLKTGETVVVREMIYGLMLPSGNDAAIALAEFTGARLSGGDESPEAVPPISRFIAEMNRTAEELGMKQTRYVNPHGLPDKGHLSSAIDQVILTAKALQDPRFRSYAKTRQHAVQVQGPGGYTRNIVWKNGNKLLEIDGYTGVKTGTTDNAGACLACVGTRQDDELIVVVLGCSSDEARYVDTRNLFRWAWRKRGGQAHVFEDEK